MGCSLLVEKVLGVMTNQRKFSTTLEQYYQKTRRPFGRRVARYLWALAEKSLTLHR